MGFKSLYRTFPSYYYILDKGRTNRLNFKKTKLKDFLGDKFDDKKTESQNMKGAGYKRIFDCGTLKVKWERK